MSFTVSPASTRVSQARTRVPLAPLKPSVNPWFRVTADGVWAFEHLEDATTSWTVAHLPTKTLVESCLGSLRQCRAYVGSGEAKEDLDRITKEGTAA